MKRIISLICLFLLLSACVKKEDEEVIVVDEKTKTETYVENMDDYIDFEICFLGTIDEENDINKIIERAKTYEGLDFIDEIDNNHIVFGDIEEINYVYLIIPNKNTDLSIGRYNYYADEMTEIWYKEENSKPVIYVETAKDWNPVGIINYVRSIGNNSNVGSMYTGIEVMESKLRTNYLMGIVDITPYDKYTSGELPVYTQFIFDTLYYEVPEFKEEIDKGKEIATFEEFIFDGRAFGIMYINDENSNQTLYGVNYSVEDNKTYIIKSNENMEWSYIKY